jgi:predicted nucleotidyltransferase/uncharacterized protein (UPF0332 family)
VDFNIERLANPNTARYKKHDLDLAYEFSKRMYKELGSFIKAIVLFGSITKPNKKEGDIDILIIVDDVTVNLSAEFVEAYRIIAEKQVLQVSPKIHVTTMKLSNFFEYVKVGDPIGINIMRDGVPLMDTGFFEPLQALLKQGRIKPTKECIWAYYTRAPMTLQNARWHILQACLDLYWAVIDASHAALMSIGETPPSPDHVAAMIEKRFVDTKILPKKYSNIMKAFYELSRKILHSEINRIDGIQYDHYVTLASDYIDAMKKIIDRESKRI